MKWTLMLVALTALAVPGPSRGQANTPADRPAAAVPAVDPRATDALDRMGKALREMKQFSLRADTTTEIVMEDGQKLEFAGSVDYKVRPPSGLHAEISNDRSKRQLFYDGKTLTVYSPSTKYYARLPAPGTLGELAVAAEEYGLEMPLADLFWWGTDRAPKSAITGATYVGPARLGGRNLAHYAFRQPGVDWQVWLDGDALPRKLVITNNGQVERPEYTALLDWNQASGLGSADFTFTPADDAYEIEFLPAVAVIVEE